MADQPGPNYAMGHKSMYEGVMKRSQIPMSKPSGLGSKIPTAEEQIEDMTWAECVEILTAEK